MSRPLTPARRVAARSDSATRTRDGPEGAALATRTGSVPACTETVVDPGVLTRPEPLTAPGFPRAAASRSATPLPAGGHDTPGGFHAPAAVSGRWTVTGLAAAPCTLGKRCGSGGLAAAA